MRHLAALSTVTFSLVAGCTSINSTPTDMPGDGLVYFMPKKDILVTVVKAQPDSKGSVGTTVTIASTSAYADQTQPYVLNFNRNLIGKNELNVGIGTSGLLSSTKSTTTSGVTDALKNLAESLGTLHAKQLAAPAPACDTGTHTFLYSVEPGDKAQSACGMKVTVTRLAAQQQQAAPAASTPEASAPPKSKEQGYTGIFYRQEEAFLVVVGGGALNSSAIILSPSLAKVRFLPIEKTFFGSNQADFGFVDGMPTKYDQNADGELIALLKLPADVIGAYFGAVGKVFDSFKAQDDKQADALASSLKLELAKKKYDACIEAIKARNDPLIQQLDCSK